MLDLWDCVTFAAAAAAAAATQPWQGKTPRAVTAMEPVARYAGHLRILDSVDLLHGSSSISITVNSMLSRQQLQLMAKALTTI
jgi:hypothetical protein